MAIVSTTGRHDSPSSVNLLCHGDLSRKSYSIAENYPQWSDLPARRATVQSDDPTGGTSYGAEGKAASDAQLAWPRHGVIESPDVNVDPLLL